MKRWLWLVLLLLPCDMHAQVVGPGFINYVTSAPSGTCSQGEQMRVVIGLGTVYTCQSGTWATVGGAGGSTAWSTITSGVNADTGAFSTAGPWTFSAAGAASTPGVTITGLPFVGTATTGTPQLYFLTTGSASCTSWSTAGTYLGICDTASFNGNFIDFKHNGSTTFSVSKAGAIVGNNTMSIASNGSYIFSGSSIIQAPSNGVFLLTNNAQTGLTRVDFGVATSSGPAFGISGTTITAQLADGTVGGTFAASKYASVANCSNAASPAVCAAANAGVVAVPTGVNPTLTINTTAITATSQVFLQIDESATIAATTCNTTLTTLVQPVVTARVAATSFTIQIGATLATNPACVSYFIIN